MWCAHCEGGKAVSTHAMEYHWGAGGSDESSNAPCVRVLLIGVWTKGGGGGGKLDIADEMGRAAGTLPVAQEMPVHCSLGLSSARNSLGLLVAAALIPDPTYPAIHAAHEAEQEPQHEECGGPLEVAHNQDADDVHDDALLGVLPVTNLRCRECGVGGGGGMQRHG